MTIEEVDEQKERTPEEELARPDLALLEGLRAQVQRLRIAEGNRTAAAEKLGQESRRELHEGYRDRLAELEDSITKSLKPEVESHPCWEWLGQIRGVGHTSAALVLAHIDITRCDTVSALWRYAGYAVIDGQRERMKKGEKAHYNSKLKRAVWLLTDLQVKTRGPFRKLYDDAKHRYTTTRPTWTKGHVENAARRYASKMFLSMLWEVWRSAEGLPTRSPWIEQYGDGQHDLIDPWEFIKNEPPTPSDPV